jgi:hypothetical protein
MSIKAKSETVLTHKMLEKIAVDLAALPAKVKKKISNKEAIIALAPHLNILLNERAFSRDDVVKELAKHSIACTPNTLRIYLKEAENLKAPATLT